MGARTAHLGRLDSAILRSKVDRSGDKVDVKKLRRCGPYLKSQVQRKPRDNPGATIGPAD